MTYKDEGDPSIMLVFWGRMSLITMCCLLCGWAWTYRHAGIGTSCFGEVTRWMNEIMV